MPIVSFAQKIDTTIYFQTPLLHLSEGDTDYKYQKKSDWKNFMRVYPDSCRHVLPLVENISFIESKKIERNIKSKIDSKDTSYIVPWHSIFREFPLNFYSFSPDRLMDRCKICNSRLLALQVYLPHELRWALEENIDIGGDPQLLYCEHCHKQVGITDGNEYYDKTRVSKIPRQMIGFWENCSSPHIWTTRGPARTILEITEEGLIKIWSESLFWQDYEFEPTCIWINSSLTFRGSYYLMLDNNKLYTFRGKDIYIHNLDDLTDKRLVVSDDVYISLKPAIPHLFRGDKESSVYHKISPPYTVFPNVLIGNFPNMQIRDLPSFWHSIKDAVILTDTTVSDEQKSLLDSLNIESHFIPILKDSVMIDVQKVLNILDIIHEIESKGKKVLILCDSEGHLLSKLIGECYHYQKTNKLLDNKILQSTNAIDYYCQKGMLPSLEELKGMLRDNKRKKL